MTLPWWIALLVLALWLLLTRTGRIVAGIALGILVVVGLQRALFRGTGCELSTDACHVELEPRWAGFCWSSPGGAIATENGQYVLVGDGLSAAKATCLDLRIYR
jgi:hypothetical protein